MKKRTMQIFTKSKSWLMLVLLSPITGFGTTLGSISDEALIPVSIMAKAFYAMCYTIGFALLVGAAIQYKDHRRNAQQVPISKPILYLIFGLILICIPILAHYSTGAHIVDEE